jgi:hypothetical protein
VRFSNPRAPGERERQGKHVLRYSAANAGGHMMVHGGAMAGGLRARREDSRDCKSAQKLDRKIEGREAGSPA